METSGRLSGCRTISLMKAWRNPSWSGLSREGSSWTQRGDKVLLILPVPLCSSLRVSRFLGSSWQTPKHGKVQTRPPKRVKRGREFYHLQQVPAALGELHGSCGTPHSCGQDTGWQQDHRRLLDPQEPFHSLLGRGATEKWSWRNGRRDAEAGS